MADSNEKHLIKRTAEAIARDHEARVALERAEAAALEAQKELREAWGSLREHQDAQVASALRLVA